MTSCCYRTYDNIVKMIAIAQRLHARVPTILCGETGCGKTFLVGFLSAVLHYALVKMDVHAGISADDIVATVDKANAEASSRERRFNMGSITHPGEQYVLLFFDEVNTNENLGLFKEIVCDRTCRGVPLRYNVRVLAACNPRRKRSARSIEAEQQGSSALPLALLAAQAGGAAGNAAVASQAVSYVYHVHPLPDSMSQYLWNFGSLSSQDEKEYVPEMLRQQLALGPIDLDREFEQLQQQQQSAAGPGPAAAASDQKHGGVSPSVKATAIPAPAKSPLSADDQQFVTGFSELLCESQSFVRDVHGGEVSMVSLRDIARCIRVFRWFRQLIQQRQKQENTPRAIKIMSSNDVCVVAAVLALGHVYLYRLPSDDRRRDYMTRIVTKAAATRSFKQFRSVDDFRQVLNDQVQWFVKLLRIPDGIALNKLLSENLFLLFVGWMTRIPLLIIGRPGSSKTLAVSVLRDSLNQKYMPQQLKDLGLPAVQLVPFQCSSSTHPSAIHALFQQAMTEQRGALSAKRNAISVVFMDEASLAEISPFSPLKALHSLLEIPQVSFVALSNYQLDSAKMNRMVVHRCSAYDGLALTETASKILDVHLDHQAELSSHAKRQLNSGNAAFSRRPQMVEHAMQLRSPAPAKKFLLDSVVPALATTYESFHRQFRDGKVEFFGARDFFGAVQHMARTDLSSSSGGWEHHSDSARVDAQLLRAILRNLGGRPRDQFWLALLRDCLPGRSFDLSGLLPTPLELVAENINEAMNVMKIQRNDTAVGAAAASMTNTSLMPPGGAALPTLADVDADYSSNELKQGATPSAHDTAPSAAVVDDASTALARMQSLARHVMVLTDDADIVALLRDEKVLPPGRTVIVFGSHFPKDSAAIDNTHILACVNSFVQCMESGKVALLIASESFHDAFCTYRPSH